MVTINIFPPSDTSQKQGENSTGILTQGPEPVKFDITETPSTSASPPSPTMQVTNEAMSNDTAPIPNLQPGSFQDQAFPNDSPPPPTMDFVDATTSFQSAPDPMPNPESSPGLSTDSPAPSLLPPGEDTENSGKSFSKKK